MQYAVSTQSPVVSRSMLTLVAAVALGLVAIGEHLSYCGTPDEPAPIYHASATSASKSGKRVRAKPRSLGTVDLSDEKWPHIIRNRLAALAEADNVVSVTLGGDQFRDEMMDSLAQMKNVQFVIIDSARVKNSTVRRLLEVRPGIQIIFSQRRVLKRLRRHFVEQHVESGGLFDVSTFRLESSLAPVDPLHLERVVRIERRFSMSGSSPPLDRYILSALPYLTTLRRLDLSEVVLDDEDLATLSGLHQLESLSLSGTDIVGRGLRYVPCDRLETLDLSNTRFRGSSLSRFSHLRYLNLQNTAFSDRDVDSILALDDLERLYVCGAQLTSRGIIRLRELKALKVVLIDERYRDSYVQRNLRRYRKDLKVLFATSQRRKHTDE